MRVVGEKYCAAQIGERGDLNSVAALRRVFFASAATTASAAAPPAGSAPSPVEQHAASAGSCIGHFWVAVDTARAVGDRVCGQVALQDKGDGAGELRRMAVRAACAMRAATVSSPPSSKIL